MSNYKENYTILSKLVKKLIKATGSDVSDNDKLLALSGFKCLLIDNGLFHNELKKDNDKAVQFSLEIIKNK